MIPHGLRAVRFRVSPLPFLPAMPKAVRERPWTRRVCPLNAFPYIYRKNGDTVATPPSFHRTGHPRDGNVTENYHASFEAARRQVASAERAGEEWGRVVEAIHALARSAQRVHAAEREKCWPSWTGRWVQRRAGMHPG